MPINKVCLITPGHISSNPRLIKEAQALGKSGYLVYVIFTRYLGYLKIEDEKLMQAHPEWQFYYKDWLKEDHFYNKLVSGIKRHLAEKLHRILPLFLLKKIILNRFYNWQKNTAIRLKADLYIAHNASAIAVAADAAIKNKAFFGFDAEDFHRGEGTGLNTIKIIKNIEDQYLPHADYISGSSPMISAAYQKLFPAKNIISVVNVFPKTSVSQKKEKNGFLNLFWFSQTIGKNRGIEEVISAFAFLKEYPIQLHLLGALQPDIELFFTSLMQQHSSALNHKLVFHKPVSPSELMAFSSTFDIGLAIEKSEPYNHDICLGNKLFTYLQSGLAVLISDTSAQKDFMINCFGRDNTVNLKDTQLIAAKLLQYIKNPQQLDDEKKFNYQLGQNKLNWEIEQQKLISTIESLQK